MPSSPVVGSLKGEGCTAVIVTSAPDMLLSESEADIVRKSFTTLQALGWQPNSALCRTLRYTLT